MQIMHLIANTAHPLYTPLDLILNAPEKRWMRTVSALHTARSAAVAISTMAVLMIANARALHTQGFPDAAPSRVWVPDCPGTAQGGPVRLLTPSQTLEATSG